MSLTPSGFALSPPTLAKTPACIIVGDLSLDVVCSVATPTALNDLVANNDVTEDVDSVVSLGGSAWLFANALRSSSASAIPIIISSVGSDHAAGFIQSQLTERGLVTTGILAADMPTNICLMIYFAQHQRLMTFPSSSAPKVDDPEACAAALDAISNEFRLHCVWISGHSMIRPTTRRLHALRFICDAVRRDGGRVVFDFVPHGFRKVIGEISVIERLGNIDGIVGEYPTFEDLGLVAPATQENSRAQMIHGAVYISKRYHRLCVVQGKIDDYRYGQAVAQDGLLIDWQDAQFTSETLRGLGDRLAVDALVRASFL